MPLSADADAVNRNGGQVWILQATKACGLAPKQGRQEPFSLLGGGRVELGRRIRIEQPVGRMEHPGAMLRQLFRNPQPIGVG